MAHLIGIDVGGTNLRVGIVTGTAVVHETRFQADFSSICKSNPADVAWQKILASLTDAVAQARQGYAEIAALGIGFPGFVDPHSGRVSQSPNLPGLKDVDLAGELSLRLQLPVIVENDATAAAYGEYRLGDADGGGLIYLGLGTGVGGGLIQAGSPFNGEHGYAMEVGHLILDPGGRLCGCGNRGCMERYASASGVAISYQEASGTQLSAHAVADLAQAGDAHAQAAYSLAGDYLARAICHILKVVDVTRVVIGGGMSQAWPLMQAAFDSRLQADLIPVLRGKVEIRLSASGDQAGMLGAALLAGVRSGI